MNIGCKLPAADDKLQFIGIRRYHSLHGIKKRTAAFIAALAALIVLSAALFWPAQCLTVKNGGKLLLAWPISKGERFEVTFTHSLNLSPITDVIEWTGRDMVVVKSIFKTFGAGVPIPSDGVGTELIHIGDHYELIGIDKHLRSIPIVIQEVPDHRITLNGCEARLLEMAGTGDVVELSVRLTPRIIRLMLKGSGLS